MSRTPNKYHQEKTLNKGASKYTEAATGGPDSMCSPNPSDGTGLNRKSGEGYNVNKRGGCYEGRNVSEPEQDMPANPDPRD